jgi:hypothetical protein
MSEKLAELTKAAEKNVTRLIEEQRRLHPGIDRAGLLKWALAKFDAPPEPTTEDLLALLTYKELVGLRKRVANAYAWNLRQQGLTYKAIGERMKGVSPARIRQRVNCENRRLKLEEKSRD